MTTIYESAQLTLARITLVENNSLRQALNDTCRVVASTMGISRISVWLFMPGSDAIRCEYLYQPDQAEAFEGTLLHRAQFPHYFKALEAERAVPIADMSDPTILTEFLTSYMQPLSITSMLDAPVYRTGRIIGVVCHEQTHSDRLWTPEDELLAAYTADTVSRLYEEAARHQAELMLHTHQAHAQELERIASMGQMAAAVAHDFKNVLHGIMAYADMIASTAGDNARIRELVDKQISTVDIGTKLAQSLMSLGKNDSSQPRVIDAAKSIWDHLPILEKAAGYKARINLNFPEKICQVFINEGQLQQVIFNLVMNAKDAITDHGEIKISIYEDHRPTHTGDNGLYVTIEVADNGKGMDENTINKLFQPYFTTKGDKGTGLGMTITQQIVTLVGGFVDVESSEGNGTRIKVRLPRIGSASPQ